ncbi:MAG: ABC transporter permease [Chloroflexaceae bacterium]|nr:ABC transporter permease [Chloroflexaceae bacterium]
MRTALVVLSIALGVFAVATMSISQVVLSHNIHDSYMAINPPSARLDTEVFQEEVLQAVRHMPIVGEADARYRLTTRVLVGADEWRTLMLYAIDDYDDIRINKIAPVSGAWPPPRHEMLLERATLNYLDAQIGGPMLVETPGGKQRWVPVAGLVEDTAQVAPSLMGQGYGYITMDTLEWLGEQRGFNEISVIAAENPYQRESALDVAAAVRDQRLEGNGVTVSGALVAQPGEHPLNDLLQTLMVMLNLFGWLSLVLSGFLVVNTIGALLTQQTRQIGIMKALGAGRTQILLIYLTLVLLFGAIATLMALPLSALGAYGFCSLILTLFNFHLRAFPVPFQLVLLMGLVGVGTPLLAAFYPVLAGTRITVREAMNSQGQSGRSSSGFRGISGLIQRVTLLPYPLLLSLRNTVRRKGRLLLTLTTLSLGGAMFVSVFSVYNSLFRTLDDITRYWQYDLEVDVYQPYLIRRMESQILKLPGVVAVESWSVKNAFRLRPDGSENEGIRVIAPAAGSRFIEPVVLAGRWLLPEDENAIVINSDVLREEPDIQVGDLITLKIDRQKITWKVVGIITGQLNGSIVYVNRDYLARAAHDAGSANRLVLRTEHHDPASLEAMRGTLEAHFRRTGTFVSSIETRAEKRLQLEALFNISTSASFMMALIIALVGGIGLAGTMSLNVMERTREIGIMRSIGALTYDLLQMVVVEGIFIGLMSSVTGILGSYPLGKMISDLVGAAFLNAPLHYTFGTDGALIWFVVAIILAALASLLPAWRAARFSVREVLAYE